MSERPMPEQTTAASATAAPPAKRRRRLGAGARASLAALLGLVLVGLGADLLASEWPLLLRFDGELSLPALHLPRSLRGLDPRALPERLDAGRGDWAVATPVPFGPNAVDLAAAPLPAPPSARHPLGTDELGRDVLARILHGARYSLLASLAAVALYLVLGILLGAVAGYGGGAADALVARATEAMITFPTVLLVIALMAVLDRPGIGTFVLVVGLTRWPDVCRLTRAEVLRLKQAPFVEAARALGAGPARVVLRHVLPNAAGPLLVAAAFGLAYTVILESGLSMLGLGVPPPLASWGELLAEAQRCLVSPGAWWLAVYPGLALFVVVTACNLLGEGLRDRLDPRAGARGAAPVPRALVPVDGTLARGDEKTRASA